MQESNSHHRYPPRTFLSHFLPFWAHNMCTRLLLFVVQGGNGGAVLPTNVISVPCLFPSPPYLFYLYLALLFTFFAPSVSVHQGRTSQSRKIIHYSLVTAPMDPMTKSNDCFNTQHPINTQYSIHTLSMLHTV